MSIVTTFLLLLMVTFAVIAYFSRPSNEDNKIQQRLSGLDRLTEATEPGIVKQVTFSNIPAVDQFLRAHRFAPELQLMLEQAKLSWTVGRFGFYSAGLLLAGTLIGNYWLPYSRVGLLIGLPTGLLPYAWVAYQRSANLRKFTVQLPEAIDLISRALRARHALPSALVIVGDEMPEPVGSEFRRVADELNFGLPFREALLSLSRRIPVQDLQFLISAILIQKETGGNLSELLDKTAALLRSRIHLQQKVRVFTAQGRLTGAILFALPFLSFLLLSFVKPGYGEPLFETSVGQKMIYGTLLSMVIGFFVIRKIVKVKY